MKQSIKHEALLETQIATYKQLSITTFYSHSQSMVSQRNQNQECTCCYGQSCQMLMDDIPPQNECNAPNACPYITIVD